MSGRTTRDPLACLIALQEDAIRARVRHDAHAAAIRMLADGADPAVVDQAIAWMEQEHTETQIAQSRQRRRPTR